MMFISFIYLVMLIFLSSMIFVMNQGVYLLTWKINWVGFFMDWEILLNIWSLLFLLMVLLISSSVMMFSFAYMNGMNVSNFIFLYLSFIVSMLWLIMNNNFYWMMFGWDGLGVVSFLLIVFYMNNESINNGLFTLFQNRVGDVFFVIFLLGMLNLYMWSSSVISFGLLVLILGGSVKSAQFPFNAWLLAAMSAPTPVSSLVHSSTLVVAGVFILLQYSYCLVDVLQVLKFISMLSLMLSAFGLLNENDMKKLIAYSTMSHVSLMMYLMSFKLFKVVYFHLNIHAMFKSLMFMCFGFVMLASFHSQDKRIVSYTNLSPVIKMVYYFSCMCLAGLPFLSGFFSKDLILEKMMELNLDLVYIIMLMMFLALSIYYSFKLLFLNKILFSYSLVEKNLLGLWGVLIMMSVMILLINIFLSLVFSLSLEYFSVKISIYLMILLLLSLSILTNLNYKLNFYAKMVNFKESWSLTVLNIDFYVYWNIFVFLNIFSSFSKMKLLLLLNWWVMVLFLILF